MNWGDALIILGIDPGLATMGWGVIESDGSRHRLIQYGTLAPLRGSPSLCGCAPSIRACSS